jgi:DNA-binding NarL/FixJ family response regulator
MADQKSAMQAFFENQTCLVVETSKSFQASIHQCLKTLDLPNLNVILISKYEDAVKKIEELKPRIIITEYDLDGQKGLALVELQQKHFEDQSRISIVISKNSSDSVVAEAAEEQVDSFILKPFSPDDFRKKLVAVIERKVNPSPYSQKIKEGRQAFSSKDYEKAKLAFTQAKSLIDKPALACFYMGDSYRALTQTPEALAEFKEGRKYNPLHYKCLIGEFEILVDNKDYNRAYELIPILIKNFPLTPRRLTQVFIAAVFSLKFDYLPDYYEQLLKLDQRSPELIKIASVALFTGGKWYLQKQDLKHACDLFEKALTVVSRDITFLDQVIAELMKANAKAEVQYFFGRAQPADIGTPAYNRLSFKVDEYILPRDAMLEKARKFAFSDEASADNFKTIVRMFAEAGKIPMAESIITKAIASNPEIRQELYDILKKYGPPET